MRKQINNFFGRRFRMVIKCTLLVPLKNSLHYVKKISELPPSLENITQRGPFIKKDARDKNRIIMLFEFDESRSAEAWEIVLKHLNVFRDIPGFSFLAHCSDGLHKVVDWQSIGLKYERLVPITKKKMRFRSNIFKFLMPLKF